MNVSWILAVLLGLMTGFFVVDQYLGISVFLMTAVAVYTMYTYKRSASLKIGIRFYGMAAYMMVLSLVPAITTVGVIRFWTCVILMLLTLALAVCENPFYWPLWLSKGLKAFGGSMMNMGYFFMAGKSMSSEGRKQVGHIVIGLILSVPILAVAAGLLSSADHFMSEFIESIFDGLALENAGVWFFRFLLFLLVATITFGYSIWFAGEREEEGLKEARSPEVIPATVSGTILVLLNLLYLVFAYIQIRFLFFGSQGSLPGDYNYAEYARSGFFELLALAMLNTAGILIINRFTRSHRFNHISLTVTAGCTFVMIASSWFKMHLYETAYGYTQLRLYVYLILAFMTVFMGLITLGIWQRHYRVVEWSILVGLAYFLVIGFINVDALIVENNMERYYETGALDIYYLMTELSEDGIPAVIGYVEKDPEIFENAIHTINRNDFLDGNYQVTLDAKAMEVSYESMKRRVVNRDEGREFFEFNLRHSKAMKEVQ